MSVEAGARHGGQGERERERAVDGPKASSRSHEPNSTLITQPNPSRPSTDSSLTDHHHLPAHLASFDLPSIPAARQSASSLMDAIFGENPNPTTQTSASPSPLNAFAEPFQSTSPPPKSHTPPAPPIQFKRRPKNGVSRTPSGRSQAGSDVMGDAESRLNERKDGEEVVPELMRRGEMVDELQKKVDRRKSQLPQLESELALLEAQIKAAEERLARVQVAQPAADQV